jgi:hypothetical protein
VIGARHDIIHASEAGDAGLDAWQQLYIILSNPQGESPLALPAARYATPITRHSCEIHEFD